MAQIALRHLWIDGRSWSEHAVAETGGSAACRRLLPPPRTGSRWILPVNLRVDGPRPDVLRRAAGRRHPREGPGGSHRQFGAIRRPSGRWRIVGELRDLRQPRSGHTVPLSIGTPWAT